MKKGSITVRQIIDARNRILQQGGIKPTEISMASSKYKDPHWLRFEEYCRRYGIDIRTLEWYK